MKKADWNLKHSNAWIKQVVKQLTWGDFVEEGKLWKYNSITRGQIKFDLHFVDYLSQDFARLRMDGKGILYKRIFYREFNFWECRAFTELPVRWAIGYSEDIPIIDENTDLDELLGFKSEEAET